jgi:hypothetical protein
MDVIRERKRLEQERIDLELNRSRDVLYVRLLFFLGTISVLGAIILLTMDRVFFGQGIGVMTVGVVLVLMGTVWQYNDNHRIEKLDQKIEHLREQELQGIHDIDEY